jgi:hypothetical protein
MMRSNSAQNPIEMGGACFLLARRCAALVPRCLWPPAASRQVLHRQLLRQRWHTFEGIGLLQALDKRSTWKQITALQPSVNRTLLLTEIVDWV